MMFNDVYVSKSRKCGNNSKILMNLSKNTKILKRFSNRFEELKHIPLK